MNILLEIFFTKLEPDCITYHRHTTDITDSTEDPDELVLNIVESETDIAPSMIDNNFVIHSTSWRYEKQDIVLTYIAYSDNINFANHPTQRLLFDEFVLAKSDNSKQPRPKEIREEHVISHAIRHLGFLIKTSEREKYTQAIHSDHIKLLEKVSDNLAGKI